jgi:hypothetical protein
MDSHSFSKESILSRVASTATWARLKLRGDWSAHISMVQEQVVEELSTPNGSTMQVRRPHLRRDRPIKMTIDCRHKGQRHNHQTCKLEITRSKKIRAHDHTVSALA